MKGKAKSKKKGKSKHSLSGVSEATHAYIATAKEGGLILLTALAAGGVGAAIGKPSLVFGIPLTFYGIHKNNKYLIATGLGMSLSNGFQKKASQKTTTQGVDGFDLKQMAQDAKDRVGTFFENFKDKLYLSPTPPAATTTNGLGEAEDQVTYFINPYEKGTGDIDMTALDKVQERIAEMNKNVSGTDEIEREF